MHTFQSCDFSVFESQSRVKLGQSCLITKLEIFLSNLKLHQNPLDFYIGYISRSFLFHSIAVYLSHRVALNVYSE